MHVEHLKGKVCTILKAAALSDSHLVGLLLHEFGHLAGGADEPAANAWVTAKLGVVIQYRGSMELQWVDPEIAARILA